MCPGDFFDFYRDLSFLSPEVFVCVREREGKRKGESEFIRGDVSISMGATEGRAAG